MKFRIVLLNSLTTIRLKLKIILDLLGSTSRDLSFSFLREGVGGGDL